jgi:hypothetical protein
MYVDHYEIKGEFQFSVPTRIIKREVKQGRKWPEIEKYKSVQLKCESDAGRIEKYMCLFFIEQ